MSHTDTVDADLGALLALTPSIVELDVNFCESLTDSAIEALPQSISRCSGRVQHGQYIRVAERDGWGESTDWEHEGHARRCRRGLYPQDKTS